MEKKTRGTIKAGFSYLLIGCNGKFLSRIRRGSIDYIEAEKSIVDVHCHFKASLMYNGKVSFKGDDGGWNFLSRYTRNSVDNIESAKTTIDIHCEFEVEMVDGDQGVYFKADNGKYLGVIPRDGRNNIEACFTRRCKETCFTVLEVV